jgi:cytochrome P450
MTTTDALPLTSGGEWGHELIAALDEQRERHTIAPSERGYEVFRFEEGQALLRDRRLGTDHMALVRHVGIPEGPIHDFKERMLLSSQGARRTKLRIPVSRLLAPAGAQGMVEVIRAIAGRLFDELDASGECDLLRVCERMPAELYCHWVDAPSTDAPFVARISDQVLSIFNQDPADRDRIVSGYEELFPYLQERIAERRAHPGEDFLSHLIGLQESGKLTEPELADYAAMLLEASTDNTTHQIANMLGIVLERPATLRRLAADPALIPRMVEESIRYRARMVVQDRITREPVSIDGVDVPAGCHVFVWTWAAHRDPRMCASPEVLDISSDEPRPTLNFGGGEYACLGQHVARLEMAEVLRVLVERFPDASLARPVGWWHSGFTSGASSLPVRLRG